MSVSESAGAHVSRDGGRPAMLIGTRGTLEPDPAYERTLLMAGERWSGVRLPSLMEQAIEPWMAKASRELAARVMPAQLLMGGEPVPLAGLCRYLKERLADLLTFAVAECLEDRAGDSLELPEFYRMFPALAPLVSGAVAGWVAATALFLARLHAESGLLARAFGVCALPALESISAAAADVHPGAGVVLRLGFRGGACLYYKPRPVSGDWLWRGLLSAIAEIEPALKLPAPRIDSGDERLSYGWAESVIESEAWPVRDESAFGADAGLSACAFWRSAGALLCVAQHMGMTDLHLGNLLATQCGPAVLDAECFATPQTGMVSRESDRGFASGFGSALDSLHATGLLPCSSPLATIDTSGLFGRGGVAVPVAVPCWAVARDEHFRLVTAPAVLAEHGNAPAASSRLATIAPVCEGYRHAAEVLPRVWEQMMESRSRWRWVLETVHAPRVLLRDTLEYGLLLSRSLSGDRLRSEKVREQSIEAALCATGGRYSNAVVRAEAGALMAGCVPRLQILPGSCTLADSTDGALAFNFAEKTPAQAVLGAMEALTPDRLEHELLPALLATFI